MQLWMAVQLSAKMESFLNATAVDLTEFTLTEVEESKPKSAGMTTNWREAFDMLKGMATGGISTIKV